MKTDQQTESSKRAQGPFAVSSTGPGPKVKRPWHQPVFSVLDVAETQNHQGNTPDNPGVSHNHS